MCEPFHLARMLFWPSRPVESAARSRRPIVETIPAKVLLIDMAMRTLLLTGFLFFALQCSAFAEGQDGQAPSAKCAIGPQERTYGQTKWLLYGCEGIKAATLVPAKGNPAAPFFFLVFHDEGKYKIYGEGIGDKKTSDAAMRDLENLSAVALAKMILDAQSYRR